jgi:hypothetical protein
MLPGSALDLPKVARATLQIELEDGSRHTFTAEQPLMSEVRLPSLVPGWLPAQPETLALAGQEREAHLRLVPGLNGMTYSVQAADRKDGEGDD